MANIQMNYELTMKTEHKPLPDGTMNAQLTFAAVGAGQQASVPYVGQQITLQIHDRTTFDSYETGQVYALSVLPIAAEPEE